jgi:hypothetical protein
MTCFQDAGKNYISLENWPWSWYPPFIRGGFLFCFSEFAMLETWFSWKISIANSEPLIFVKDTSFVIIIHKLISIIHHKSRLQKFVCNYGATACRCAIGTLVEDPTGMRDTRVQYRQQALFFFTVWRDYPHFFHIHLAIPTLFCTLISVGFLGTLIHTKALSGGAHIHFSVPQSGLSPF